MALTEVVMKVQLTMELEKETFGAVRYQEVAGDKVLEMHEAYIGKLYIRKSKLNNYIPRTIIVTIEQA